MQQTEFSKVIETRAKLNQLCNLEKIEPDNAEEILTLCIVLGPDSSSFQFALEYLLLAKPHYVQHLASIGLAYSESPFTREIARALISEGLIILLGPEVSGAIYKNPDRVSFPSDGIQFTLGADVKMHLVESYLTGEDLIPDSDRRGCLFGALSVALRSKKK